MLKVKPTKVAKFITEKIIFNVRWLLVFFIAKLILTMIYLLFIYYTQDTISHEQLIKVIEAMDVLLIAGLIEMMITGTYNSSIDKEHGYQNKNISSGVLKIKMSVSLVCASSVHLFKIFMETQKTSMEDIIKKSVIHIAFILGAVSLVYIHHLLTKAERQELENEEYEKQNEHKNHNKPNKHSNEKV